MEYRMYSFVLRQLNPMQKGVQTTHAVVEYAEKQGKDNEGYHKWANEDKTLIVLDGGIYQDMMEIMGELFKLGIKFEPFYEPDLNNMCTAIAVLADERVWNLEKYPNYDPYPQPPSSTINGVKVTLAVHIEPIPYEEWVEHMGGEAIVKLRELIFSKRLAQ